MPSKKNLLWPACYTHLISFFITLLGVVLVLVLALTLLIPELVQSFHSLYLQIEANIPRWTAYLSAQNADTDWLMSWLEGINWEQLLHKITAGIDTVLINAVSAVSATVNIAVTASFARFSILCRRFGICCAVE